MGVDREDFLQVLILDELGKSICVSAETAGVIRCAFWVTFVSVENKWVDRVMRETRT